MHQANWRNRSGSKLASLASRARTWQWVPLILCAMATFFVAPPCQAQAVPPEFQDLYNQVQGDLDSFNGVLTGLGAGSSPKYPVLYSGELPNADPTNGPQI